MPVFPRTTALAWWLLGPGLGLLPACSPDSPAHPPVATAAPPAPAPGASGARADSLNGIPGHHFGEPLSTFPGIQRVPTNPSGYEVYAYAAGSAADHSWFGRHEAELHGQVYLFVDGQFAGLRTAAPRPGTALLQEAQYLLGPGTGAGDTRDWQGERVLASWRPTDFGTGEPYQRLEILSKPLLERQQQQNRQRLQADNAR